ncbi:hypothetical protein ACWEWI_31365 [Streptomyces sp. NPDC003753]
MSSGSSGRQRDELGEGVLRQRTSGNVRLAFSRGSTCGGLCSADGLVQSLSDDIGSLPAQLGADCGCFMPQGARIDVRGEESLGVAHEPVFDVPVTGFQVESEPEDMGSDSERLARALRGGREAAGADGQFEAAVVPVQDETSAR